MSVVSYRVRLARNAENSVFPNRMTADNAFAMCCGVKNALNGFNFVEFTGASPIAAESLRERHLISSEFSKMSLPRLAAISPDEKVCVMTPEEDTFRIQAFGSDLQSCFDEASRVDDILNNALGFAFRPDLGYITACPTNLGTGMRASCMMHIPMLSQTIELKALANKLHLSGIVVRGMYGEGTAGAWGYYQISNQLTLGVSEKEIIEAMLYSVQKICELENGVRASAYEKDPVGFADRYWRSAGLLANARRISNAEAMEALSILRVGLPGAKTRDIREIDRAASRIGPASLCVEAGKTLTAPERDELRADLLREAFGASCN